MEGENSIIRTEATTKECGEITKWMVGGNCTIKGENLLMKEIGSKISFTDMARFLMIIQQI
jgi:hypothetical protein